MGKVRVGFTRSIIIPNYDIYPELKKEENMRRNCTNGDFCDQ